MIDFYREPGMAGIKTLLLVITVMVLGTACATTEYNPTCVRQCERSNQECSQNCMSLRAPVREGENRADRTYRFNDPFANCSARCEKNYQNCRKRCKSVVSVDIEK